MGGSSPTWGPTALRAAPRSAAPSARPRGRGIGPAAVAALARRPATVPGDPPDHRGHRRPEHRLPGAARTPGIVLHGPIPDTPARCATHWASAAGPIPIPG